MGWDGAGGYTRQHNFSADASAGINILAARMDAEIDDIASAIPIAWARNGQNVPTVDMPMGGRKFVNVGAPTSVSNFMRVREFIENVPIFMQDAESSADRISVSSQYFTSVSANQAPVDGTKIMVRAKSNKSSAVLYVDGYSANVHYVDGGRIASALTSGGIYEFVYSSSDAVWRVLNPDVIDSTLKYVQTAAEISAGVTPTNYQYSESHLYRYGTNSTPGTTDMTSALQSLALVAAITGRMVIPKDDIKTTAATALPSSVVVSGDGYLSNLIATTTNQTAVFTTSSKSNVRIENVRFTGSDTSSATDNGNAIQANNSDHIKIEHCWFTLFRGPPVFFYGDSGDHHDFSVKDCFFSGNKSTSTAGEVNIYGTINETQIVGCRFEASSTEPFGRGVFVANLSSVLNWTNITIGGCYFDGYANNAVGTDDEDPSSSFDCGIVRITDCTILNIVQSGIKMKNSQRCIVTGNYLQDCDATPETAGSLQGAIFINACQDTVCSHNIVIGPGTDGIRVTGLATVSGGTAAGAGRASMEVCHNIVESAVESGIFISNDPYECTVDNNNIRNCGTGIRIEPEAAKPGLSVSASHNNIRGSTGNGSGIQADEINGLVLNGNRIKLCGGFGVSVTDCDDVVIEGNLIMDNGVGGTNTSGIRISTTNNVVIRGNRAGNDVATDQDYGVDFGASVTAAIIEGNDLTGNQIAASLGLTRDILLGNNLGANVTNNAATAAQIAAAADVINTSGKYIGKQVFDTTNGRLMIAIGSNATDQWYIADGSGSVTPA